MRGRSPACGRPRTRRERGRRAPPIARAPTAHVRAEHGLCRPCLEHLGVRRGVELPDRPSRIPQRRCRTGASRRRARGGRSSNPSCSAADEERDDELDRECPRGPRPRGRRRPGEREPPSAVAWRVGGASRVGGAGRPRRTHAATTMEPAITSCPARIPGRVSRSKSETDLEHEHDRPRADHHGAERALVPRSRMPRAAAPASAVTVSRLSPRMAARTFMKSGAAGSYERSSALGAHRRWLSSSPLSPICAVVEALRDGLKWKLVRRPSTGSRARRRTSVK